MSQIGSTCWQLIQDAAAGGETARAEFVRHYTPLVRAYLGARWRGTPYVQEVDDATQVVFTECFRPGGVLERADPEHPAGFRAFLYGVLQNAALRVETDPSRQREFQPPSDLTRTGGIAKERSLSRVFDRAWALTLVREARDLLGERASSNDEQALRRVELLRLRFEEGWPIRKIAQVWKTDPARLHHEYARVRKEFKAALMEVVSCHHPGTRAEIEQQCFDLLSLLR